MITTGTRVLQVIGDSVVGSLPHLMHGSAIRKTGINAVVAAVNVSKEKIGNALAVMRVLDFWGGSFAASLKESAISYLDGIDETARRVGAVTTIVNQGGCFRGYNTDVYGISKTLGQDLGMSLKGKTAVLLGADAICRASVVALCDAAAKQVFIVSRTMEKTAKLVDEFARIYPNTQFVNVPVVVSEMAFALNQADLLINTMTGETCVDFFPDFLWASLAHESVVLDAAEYGESASFASKARAHNFRTADASAVLLSQGEKDFELWTGILPTEGLMKNCFDEVVRNS